MQSSLIRKMKGLMKTNPSWRAGWKESCKVERKAGEGSQQRWQGHWRYRLLDRYEIQSHLQVMAFNLKLWYGGKFRNLSPSLTWMSCPDGLNQPIKDMNKDLINEASIKNGLK